MSCPFAGLATRYTMKDERVSVRICGAVPYERESDSDDLPLPSVCFSKAAWQSCPHYLRLTQRKEVALILGLVPVEAPALAGAGESTAVSEVAAFEFVEPGPVGERRRTTDTP